MLEVFNNYLAISRGISSEALFVWRKVVLGKRVTLPAESTLASVYMGKKLTPLPESRAGFQTNSARAWPDRLALTELAQLGEPMSLYGEK